MPIHLNTPLSAQDAAGLRAGDIVLFTGTVYSARDAAHKKLIALLDEGKPLPFPVDGSVIYYMGPSPARPGTPIGAAGPTTSYRMDAYAPRLIELGSRGMIGKGKRSDEVIEAMKRCGAVYFGAVGGAGALLSKCIKSCEVLAWPELGAEALCRLEVVDFPAVVVIDSLGGNLYELGPRRYLEAHGGEGNGLQK
jgi:fumarate hydratase subunit beta